MKRYFEIQYGQNIILVHASDLKSAWSACPPFVQSERHLCSLSITFEDPKIGLAAIVAE